MSKLGQHNPPILTRTCVLLAATLLAILGVTSTAGATQQSIRYVALGDSYSSGVGAGGYFESSGDCLRSPNAYPALWVNAHEVASFTFAACSGATTADVLAGQIGVLSERTTLVTISIGGNDAGFADVMTTCVLGSEQTCLERVAEAKEFARNVLPGRLDEVYATLRQHAPNAEIIVLGYPRFYELNGSCWVGLSETKRAAINSGADVLAEVTAKRVANAGLTFVDMRGPFTGHEICSDDWWLHSLEWFSIIESYHPTTEGHALGYLPALTSVTG